VHPSRSGAASDAGPLPTQSRVAALTDGWKFRPGTLDRMIFNGVVVHNEYRLPGGFAPDDIVVDIGAHIGSFAYAVVFRGAEHVWSIEPDRANCAFAAENLRTYIDKGFVQLMQRAVWRSDRNDDELRFDGYQVFPQSFPGLEGVVNTGGGSVMWGVGEPVTKVAFDDVVDLVTNRGERRVRLLKLDCEGAEWPILLTSRRLHLIDEIVGEFHEIGGSFLEIGEDRLSKAHVFHSDRVGGFTIDEFVRFLSDAGFCVTYRRHLRPNGMLEGFGLFFATREQDTT
jgi:FkbM family methyltransferase